MESIQVFFFRGSVVVGVEIVGFYDFYDSSREMLNKREIFLGSRVFC